MNNLDIIKNLIGKAQHAQLRKVHSEACPVNELLPNPYNRDLDRVKIDNIKTDIKRSGKILPLVYTEVDNDGKPSKMVVDGHHRLEALKELGYKEVPIVLQDERGVKTKAPKEEVTKESTNRRLDSLGFVTSSSGPGTRTSTIRTSRGQGYRKPLVTRFRMPKGS